MNCLPSINATTNEHRVFALVHDLEAEGYRICASACGTAYFIRMSDWQEPEVTALHRFGMALMADPRLKAGVLPFLLKHRPWPGKGV